jgi:DUF1365 family protein
METASCLYTGTVMHRRFKPRAHRLNYRVFWCLFDLDELPYLPSRLRFFSFKGFNLFGFRNSDHGDSSNRPLRAQVEAHLATAGIDLGGGAIRLLCMPRLLGFVFNPISVYYCYDRCGALKALLYQVHNTFGQRHSTFSSSRVTKASRLSWLLAGSGTSQFVSHVTEMLRGRRTFHAT